MNMVRVEGNSSRITDRGAWAELFAQENGGAWLRVTVSSQTGRLRSISVIIPPDGVAALQSWITEYATTEERSP